MERVNSDSTSPIVVARSTHEGMTGKNNEDASLAVVYRSGTEPDAPLLYLNAVADGVGGQSAGEFASRLALETIAAYFDNLDLVTLDNILDHLRQGTSLANRILFDQSETDIELHGMATTLVMAAVLDGLLFTSHIGDSRAYLWREQRLHRLTVDHTWVQEAVDAGLLTTEQGFKHPNRNIIRRSVGSIEDVEVDQTMASFSEQVFWQGMPLQVGDLLVLCSDGLTDMVRDPDIALTLANPELELAGAVQELIDKANHAGGRDNITVLLVQMADSFTPNPASPFSPPEQPPITVVAPSLANTVDLESETLRHMPRVVHVPLNKEEKLARTRRRRRRIYLYLALLLALLLVAGLFYFDLLNIYFSAGT